MDKKKLLQKRQKKYSKLEMKAYKITFEMQGPICLNDYLMLDSVLGYAVLKDILGSEYENATNSEELVEIPLPLAKTEGIWHCSAGIFDVLDTDQGSWKKRWDSQNSNLVNPHKKRSGKYSLKVNVVSGAEKAYSMPLQIYLTSKIDIYVKGNGNEIERLLKKYIPALGKKRSQGYGFFNKINFKKIKQDKSFFKDEKIMRPLNQNIIKQKVKENNKHIIDFIERFMPVQPPYWNTTASVKTLAPNYINVKGW